MTILIDPLPRRQCCNCAFWDRSYTGLDAGSGSVVAVCGEDRDATGQTNYKSTRGSDCCSRWHQERGRPC